MKMIKFPDADNNMIWVRSEEIVGMIRKSKLSVAPFPPTNMVICHFFNAAVTDQTFDFVMKELGQIDLTTFN